MPDGTEIFEVDPAELHLPPSRRDGADPEKLARQFDRHGTALEGMPPRELTRGSAGRLMINDGVTRATRARLVRPGAKVPACITDDLPDLDPSRLSRVGLTAS